mmetsp:Transcript_28268/g.67292  ORF Transcript_28268/g.67292 Transcript_28268/m.67292 type:complete len:222 (-) Transcript_28268:253-918(-)
MLGGLPHARSGLTDAALEMIRCDLLEASRGQPLCAQDAIDKSQVLLVVVLQPLAALLVLSGTVKLLAAERPIHLVVHGGCEHRLDEHALLRRLVEIAAGGERREALRQGLLVVQIEVRQVGSGHGDRAVRIHLGRPQLHGVGLLVLRPARVGSRRVREGSAQKLGEAGGHGAVVLIRLAVHCDEPRVRAAGEEGEGGERWVEVLGAFVVGVAVRPAAVVLC